MWSIIDWIHKLKVLALLIKGGYDEAQESVMQPFLSFSPFFGPDCEVKWAEFGQSSRISERGSVRSVYGGAYCGDIIILVPYDFYIIYGRAYSSSYALLRIYYFTDYIRGSKKEGESKPNKRLANSG
jgi:hypothetical protein